MKLAYVSVAFAILLLMVAPVMAITGIIGASSFSPGLCGNFLMRSGGILTFAEQTTAPQLGVAPNENLGNGNGYFAVRTATFDTRQYQINLGSFTSVGFNQINTADTPDASNGLNGSHYNDNTTRWVSAGRRSCAGPTCIHFRTYLNNAIDFDSTAVTQTSSGTGPSVTYDLTYTYMEYATSGGPRVGRWDTASYVIQDSDLVDGGFGMQGLVQDATFLYGASSPSTIKRWIKNNLPASETNFVPGFATASIRVPSLSSDGILYVPGRSSGFSPNILYRILTSTMSITGSTVFGNNQFLDQVFIDDFNDKLYVTFSTGIDAQVARINKSTLVTEQIFVGSNATNGPVLGQARIDIPHQAIYIPFNGNAGEGVKLQKVSLCL